MENVVFRKCVAFLLAFILPAFAWADAADGNGLAAEANVAIAIAGIVARLQHHLITVAGVVEFPVGCYAPRRPNGPFRRA